jgi:hypothetical protein
MFPPFLFQCFALSPANPLMSTIFVRVQWITLVVAIIAVFVAGVAARANVKLAEYTETYVELTRDLAGAATVTKHALNPLIAFDLHYVSGTNLLVVAVTNIGQGSARWVELGLTFKGPDTDHRTFTRALMTPGDTEWYHTPQPPNTGVRPHPCSSDEELGANFTEIVLTGTMRNALDEELPIDARIPNLARYLMDWTAAGRHTLNR